MRPDGKTTFHPVKEQSTAAACPVLGRKLPLARALPPLRALMVRGALRWSAWSFTQRLLPSPHRFVPSQPLHFVVLDTVLHWLSCRVVSSISRQFIIRIAPALVGRGAHAFEFLWWSAIVWVRLGGVTCSRTELTCASSANSSAMPTWTPPRSIPKSPSPSSKRCTSAPIPARKDPVKKTNSPSEIRASRVRAPAREAASFF